LRLPRGEGGAGHPRAFARGLGRDRPHEVHPPRDVGDGALRPGRDAVHRRRAARPVSGAAVAGRRDRGQLQRRTIMSKTPRHLLALDQGTSSSRSIVFDAQGRILAMAQREFRQIYPQPGWVEHDPKEILESQLATAREALAKAGLTASDIASIGITNQRETTLV